MTPERVAELRPDGASHINPGRLISHLSEALDAVVTLRANVLSARKRAEIAETAERELLEANSALQAEIESLRKA